MNFAEKIALRYKDSICKLYSICSNDDGLVLYLYKNLEITKLKGESDNLV